MAEPRVAIVGGGSTGTAIFRDLALRGLRPLLVEARGLASGATGGCQGLLHSGCRYAVTEPASAKECAAENAVMRRIAAPLVEADLVALYAALPADGTDHLESLLAACASLGIRAERLSAAEARRLAPALNPAVAGAVRTLDAPLDPFGLCLANVHDAIARGGRVMAWSPVRGLSVAGGRVVGLRALDPRSGREIEIGADLVVNAAGAFAADVAAMAGESLPMAFSKGADLVFASRLSEAFLARCRRPSDGDVIVPHGATSLWGTTSVRVGHPGETAVSRSEVEQLLADLEELIPGGRRARLLRAYAGVRPLAVPDAGASDDRGLSRDFALRDHQAESGLGGLISVVGGKMCTCRLMAEKTCDLALAKLGLSARCETAERPLPAAGAAPGRRIRLARLTGGGLGARGPVAGGPEAPGAEGARRAGGTFGAGGADGTFGAGGAAGSFEAGESAGARGAFGAAGSFGRGVAAAGAPRGNAPRPDDGPGGAVLVCRCEAVTAAETAAAALEAADGDLGSVRIRTRLGMGPCQGAGCAYKAIGQMASLGVLAPADAPGVLVGFLERRFRGSRPCLAGAQLAQQLLTLEVYGAIVDLAEVPPRADPLAPPRPGHSAPSAPRPAASGGAEAAKSAPERSPAATAADGRPGAPSDD